MKIKGLETDNNDIVKSLNDIKDVLKGIRFLIFLYLFGIFISFIIKTILPLIGIFTFLNSVNNNHQLKNEKIVPNTFPSSLPIHLK